MSKFGAKTEFEVGQRVMSKWSQLNPWRGEIVEVGDDYHIWVKSDRDGSTRRYMAAEVMPEAETS